MKDQQEIQGVNSKFSLDRARLVRTGSVPEFRDQMERKKGQNVDKGMETRQEKKGEQKIIERREKERERRETQGRKRKRRKGGKQESEKGKKKGRRCWTFAISSLVLSYTREGSFHFSPFYGEWNL